MQHLLSCFILTVPFSRWGQKLLRTNEGVVVTLQAVLSERKNIGVL